MTITPEQLEKIAAAAEQVRKADMELTLANRNPSPSIYVQRNALRGAENKLRDLLSVETVLALVAAVEAAQAEAEELRDIAFWKTCDHDRYEMVDEWINGLGIPHNDGDGVSLAKLAHELRADIARVYGELWSTHHIDGYNAVPDIPSGWLAHTMRIWARCWGAWAKRAEKQRIEIEPLRKEVEAGAADRRRMDALTEWGLHTVHFKKHHGIPVTAMELFVPKQISCQGFSTPRDLADAILAAREATP